MRSHPSFIVIYVFVLSCTQKMETVDVRLHPDYLQGRFVVGDSTIQQFNLWGCFCNLTDSAIRITNINGGFEGQELKVTVTKNDTVFSFDTWTCVGRPPEYSVEKYSLTLDNSKPLLRDSLTGRIIVSGAFSENDKKVGFEIAGHFKCILRDSLYDFLTYKADVYRIVSEGGMKNLMKRPDSVTGKN